MQTFRDHIVAKLQAMGREYTILGDEIKTICLNPEHIDENPSYSINVNTGVSHCFSCGYKPHPSVIIDATEEDTAELLHQAKYNYLSDLMLEDCSSQENKVFHLPPEAYPIDRDWRGISQKLLQDLGVYYSDTGRFAGRLVFPVYTDDKLEGFDARIVNPSISKCNDAKWLRPKGMNAQRIVYPYNYLVNMDCSHIVLTEGVMDAVSYLHLGIPAIPTFGMAPPAEDRITTLLKLGVDTVTIGYDNDLKGREGSLKVYPFYRKWFNVKYHWATSKLNRSQFKDMNEAVVGGLFN